MSKWWLAVAIVAGVACSVAQATGNAVVPSTWIRGPWCPFAWGQTPSMLELAPNNGWSICQQDAGHPGRIHVVYTQSAPGLPQTWVWTRFSDDSGKTWTQPFRVSRNDAMYDSARTGVISSLEDSIAVAFYDDWSVSEDKLKHIGYQQSLDGGENWLERPLTVSSDIDRHFDNRHPSVAVTWMPYENDSTDRHKGPIAHVVWVDSIDRSSAPLGAWAFNGPVRMKQLHLEPWDHAISHEASCNYPSVGWNGVPNINNDCYCAYQHNLDDASEIWAVHRRAASGDDPVRVTDNAYPDARPSVQCVYGDPSNSTEEDTIAVVYQTKPDDVWQRSPR